VPIVSNLNTQSGLSIPIDSLKSFTFYNRPANWYQMPWNIYNPSGIWKICDEQDLPFLRWQGINCEYDIIAIAGSGGSISPSDTVSVVENTNQTFIFSAVNCYETDSLWIDGVYFPDSIAAGSYTFENITQNHTIEVSFKKIEYVITNIADTTCENMPYLFGNQVLTTSGIYYDTLQNEDGCDSVVCLTLEYYPSVTITDYSASFCYGKTYSDDNFTNLTRVGIYYDTLQNENGCDSVVKLTLSINPAYFSQISDSIAPGKSYDFNGRLLTTNGIYYDTLQTIFGCDSIIELILTVSGVGIKQLHLQSYKLQVYPNPTTGQLQVTSYELQENTVIEIYDVVGQLLYTSPNPSQRGEYSSPSERLGEVIIDISHLAQGLYFLKVDGKIFKVVKM
jgi:hypothetical protein